MLTRLRRISLTDELVEYSEESGQIDRAADQTDDSCSPRRQQFPHGLTRQSHHMLNNRLAHQGRSLINWGYLRKGTPDGRGSGQQALIFGGSYDGAPAMHAELVAQMVNVAAHGVRGNHQRFGDFLVGVAFG